MKLITFKQRISQFETDNWFGEYLYFKAIDRVSYPRKAIENLSLVDVTQVMRPFLLMWGQMARTINRKGTEWEKLHKNLQSKCHVFERFMDLTILEASFDDSIRHDICEVYDAVRVRNIGPTSVGKLLHLLLPDFFVPWDDEIRKNEMNRLGFEKDGQSLSFGHSCLEYARFLEKIHAELNSMLSAASGTEGKSITDIIEEVLKIRPEVSTERLGPEYIHKKTLAKLFDEYAWASVWKGF